MPKRGPRADLSTLLFIADEKAVLDPARIRAYDRLVRRRNWIIGLPFLIAGIAITGGIVFFQITNIIYVPGIPLVPALGAGVLPALVCLTVGLGEVYEISHNPLRQYLKRPADFKILNAAVTAAEKTRTGRSLFLTIKYDSPYGLEKTKDEYREKVNVKFWDAAAALPRQAWVIWKIRQTDEKVLLAVLKAERE